MRHGVPLAMSLWLSSVAAVSRAQEPPKPPSSAEEQTVEATEPVEPQEEATGPAQGAPTVTLAKAQFYPRFTPRYQRSAGTDLLGLDLSQKLPWTGATITAGGTLTATPENENPFPRAADLRFVVTQPLLRGFGPNATSFDLQNSRRGRISQERNLELSKQRLAVQVTGAFFSVIAQRQLVSVSRQSLRRSDSLRKASEARLKIGLASKLDVFRTEIQASQTEDALVRSQAALQAALEQLRFLLALPPGHPLEPEAVRLGDHLPGEDEPVEVLVQRAFENRRVRR